MVRCGDGGCERNCPVVVEVIINNIIPTAAVFLGTILFLVVVQRCALRTYRTVLAGIRP